LLEREVIATTPVQVRYHVTDRGADLIRSLQPLVAWGERWGPLMGGKLDRASLKP
jgi:DNA-binding HxlR family transcriptional regulator